MPVEEVKADLLSKGIPNTASVSGRTGVKINPGETLETFVEESKLASKKELEKAKYKIEIIFGRRRSPNKGVLSAALILIWESGKKFHGGGDQKMYWCGHDGCGKPFSCDNFGYMHVVCPKCHREMFLDQHAREAHTRDLMSRGLDPSGLGKVPEVVGEKMVNLVPKNMAYLLEKTFRDLDSDADFYLKYSPYDIRYQGKDSLNHIIDTLGSARSHRQPVIYRLKSIIKDLHAGASLHNRLIALLTS
jgi:hypothetical protein